MLKTSGKKRRQNVENQNMKHYFFKYFLILFFFSLTPLFAQSVELSYNGSKSYSLTERTDLRKYENGKYIGLVSREVHSYISPASSYEDSPQYARDSWFDGHFYVIEERKNNIKKTVDGIYDSIPSVFHIAPNGELTMHEDHGFPSFRSFPAFPSRKVSPGDSWTSSGERAVDPKGDGKITRLKIEVRYTLEGEGIFDGREVYKISALWQTLYGMSWKDKKGDQNLTKARGGHKASIMVLKSTGEPVLVMDNVDETFVYADKTEINYKGTISLFIKYPPRMDSDKIIAALSDIATIKKSEPESGTGGKEKKSKPMGGGSTGSITSTKSNEESGKSKTDSEANKDSKPTTKKKSERSPIEAGDEKSHGENTAPVSDEKNKTGSSETGGLSTPTNERDSGKITGLNMSEEEIQALEVQFTAAKNNMIVEETNAGVRLTVQNLRFQPDSAELVLGMEGNRLDDIASVLKLAGDSQILIEGHTASTGQPAAELALSQERARKIANELVDRGIQKDKIIVRGWGSAKPIAPNTNNAGKALNRRVEITILQ